MSYQQITASFLRMLASAVERDPDFILRSVEIRKIYSNQYRFLVDDDGYDVELVVGQSEFGQSTKELDAYMTKNVIAVMLKMLRDIGEESEEEDDTDKEE